MDNLVEILHYFGLAYGLEIHWEYECSILVWLRNPTGVGWRNINGGGLQMEIVVLQYSTLIEVKPNAMNA